MPSPNENITTTGLMTYTSINPSGSGTLGTYMIYHRDRTTVSVKTPNFKKLKRGAYPINPYSYHIDTSHDPRSTFVTNSQSSTGTGPVTTWTYSMNAGSFGCQMGHTASTTADDPSQRAISKVIEQLKLGKANSLVTIAEAHKTAATVAKAATKIVRAIKALKSARFGDFANELGLATSFSERKRFHTGIRKTTKTDWKLSQTTKNGGLEATKGSKNEVFSFKREFNAYRSKQGSNVSNFIADTWLEYSYGWRPLLRDVYDHADALQQSLDTYGNATRRVKGRARTDRVTDVTTEPSNNQVRYHNKGTSIIWVEYNIQYRIPTGAVTFTKAFGLSNPLEVVWELLPFSFVADWFLPIGSAIEALSAYDGLEFHDGSKSHKHVRTWTATVVGKGKWVNGATTWFGQSGGGKVQRDEYDQGRVQLTGFPQYGFPQFKDPRSFAHAASAIALLQSLFLRKR